MNTRENIKARLSCTDEQVNRIIKIANDATVLGIGVDLDVFISFLEKEIAIQMYGNLNSKTDLVGLNIDGVTNQC